MTIYMPDDLAAEVRDKLGDTNISAVCQAALRDELRRQAAVAEVTAEGFERIEVWAGEGGYTRDGKDVAFQGRKIAQWDDQTAYLTPRGAIALHAADAERLYVYDDYQEFAAVEHAVDLSAQVAEALGEKYVEELDI